MKDSTKNAFKKLCDLTKSKCETCVCEEEYRCCDKLFCNAVEKHLSSQGIVIDKPNLGGIPYMGNTGCVVSPELRPMCTGFACNHHFDDRNFRREYHRLVDKINQDETSPKMPANDRRIK